MAMAAATQGDIGEVPTLDIGNLLHGEDRSSLLREIAHACDEWGCFQIANHGVPQKVVENMWVTALQIYEQPTDVKIRNPTLEKLPNSREATRHGQPTDVKIRNPTLEKLPGMHCAPLGSCEDWVEIFFFRRRPGICDGFKESVEVFGESIKEYGLYLENLANKLYAAIFESLGLHAEYYKAELPTIERAVLALNFYPPKPHADTTKKLAFHEHSDVGTLTIIIQDEVGGLQAQYAKTGEWVPVHYRPDVFLVLLADQIEILSNGKYKACRHRVVANTNRLRISTPFTFGPPEEELVQPLPKLLAGKDKPLFRGVVFKDYMARYFDRSLPSSVTGLNFARITEAPASE